LQALIGQTGAQIAKRKTVIVLHAQPKTTPFFQILSPLVPPQLAALEPSPPRTMAIVLVWDKRKITLDGSGQLANGIFMRFEREFDGQISYEDMARRLHTDETEIFNMLGIQEEA
jgi:hypothetical protein